MKEFGDKLSDGNKTAINEALDKLKEEHKTQDVAAIDTAMEGLNNAWQAASQEIYQAQQAAGGAEGAAGADANAGGGDATDGVDDVEYEEVNDDDKK
jgi:molecular chaperone DnaK